MFNRDVSLIRELLGKIVRRDMIDEPKENVVNTQGPTGQSGDGLTLEQRIDRRVEDLLYRFNGSQKMKKSAHMEVDHMLDRMNRTREN